MPHMVKNMAIKRVFRRAVNPSGFFIVLENSVL
jgi:hypothetical protein